MLGTTLVTAQTGSGGELVSSIYVEQAMDLAQRYFIALALDAETGGVMLLASSEGGVEFEQRSKMDPETVKTMLLGPERPDTRARLGEFLQAIGIAAVEPPGAPSSKTT